MFAASGNVRARSAACQTRGRCRPLIYYFGTGAASLPRPYHMSLTSLQQPTGGLSIFHSSCAFHYVRRRAVRRITNYSVVSPSLHFLLFSRV